MNAIIGYSEMLMEEAEDVGQPDFIPDLKKIHAAGKHLLGLINDVLDLSKIEAGKTTLYLEDFAIASHGRPKSPRPSSRWSPRTENEPVIECPPGFRDRCAPTLAEDPPDALQPAEQCRQIHPEGPHHPQHGAREQRDGRDMECTSDVADSGIGMTPACSSGSSSRLSCRRMPRRPESTAAPDSASRSAARFCQMMGGDITVTSEAGQAHRVHRHASGSASVVDASEVPAAAAPAARARRRRPDARRDPLPPAPPLVLVVDDDPAVLEPPQLAASRKRGLTLSALPSAASDAFYARPRVGSPASSPSM